MARPFTRNWMTALLLGTSLSAMGYSRLGQLAPNVGKN